MIHVPVPYDLICGLIDDLEWLAEAHEGKPLPRSRERARNLRRYVRALDRIRITTTAAKKIMTDNTTGRSHGTV